MDAIGEKYTMGGIENIVLMPDADAIAISIGRRRVASMVPIDNSGLYRMELEEGFRIIPSPRRCGRESLPFLPATYTFWDYTS